VLFLFESAGTATDSHSFPNMIEWLGKHSNWFLQDLGMYVIGHSRLIYVQSHKAVSDMPHFYSGRDFAHLVPSWRFKDVRFGDLRDKTSLAASDD